MKQFHSFRLDIVNHCLWRGEDRVLLTPKAFDVLRYLVEHADRLVTQDEILEALWPETYVNPEVIKKYILHDYRLKVKLVANSWHCKGRSSTDVVRPLARCE